MTTTHTLTAPGVRLHYEVRGTGPLLLVMGAPMSAAAFAPLADALAGDHTVVTHDPRGIGGSRLDDPGQDSTPELRADDVAALLDALGAESADVFGSSGGAVTGLALAARHPGRVRTLVAHEPPLLSLLPDAAERHAATEDIIETFHKEGVGAAWAKFMAVSTAPGALTGPPSEASDAPESPGSSDAPESPGSSDAPESPESHEPSAQDLADSAHFFAHELRGTTRYVPDIPALTSGPGRVVVAIGATSGPLLTHHTSTALAGLLGTPPAEFPGGHGGFMEQPEQFAQALREVLAGEGDGGPATG
ncbi:alpha/beta hydrolase [Streptomyces sp. NPDC005907]|uniref:alpha/beta fold hydrolase n=1 Tax=Streptomyces sp. NPDC005907 TaxID=3154571 RepID=UPI0033D232FC